MLERHVGAKLTPPASAEAYAALGAFDEQSVDVYGRGWEEAAMDIVLPGLGWVAVTGSGDAKVLPPSSYPLPLPPLLTPPVDPPLNPPYPLP